MGNYNGTVTCGVCYERGHNKRTCPVQTDRLMTRMQGYEAAAVSDPACEEHYRQCAEKLAAQIGKRIGHNPLTGKTITKRGPTRKCSYCKWKHGSWTDNGLGHTRRTCPDLREDYTDGMLTNVAFRVGVLKTLRDAGLGVGALLTQSQSGYFPDEKGEMHWDRRDCTVMIRSINWEQVNYVTPGADFIITQRVNLIGTRDGFAALSCPTRLSPAGIPMRWDVSRKTWGEDTGAIIGYWNPAEPASNSRFTARVLSPVPTTSINPPSMWDKDGDSDDLTNHFAKLKK
jgi:hypothetical protein